MDGIFVKKSYFISPKYEITRDNYRIQKGPFTKTCDVHYDSRDDFPKWIESHTIPFKIIDPFVKINGGRLMDNKGVYCEIIHLRNENINSPKFPHKANYTRVVKVSSSPPSKDLPSQLLDSLKERGYQKIEGDNKHMINLEERIKE